MASADTCLVATSPGDDFLATGERNAAFQLRYKVYIAEQGKAYPEADHARRMLTDDLDQSAEVLLVKVAGQAVGTLRANWLDSPTTQSNYPDVLALALSNDMRLAQIVVCSRLAVLPHHRHSRAHQQLFQKIYELALERGTKLCFATCAPNLLGLFRRYGFREYAQPSDNRVVGTLCRMLLVLDDTEHLAHVGSSFLAIAQRHSLLPQSRPWLSELFAARAAELGTPA